MWLSDCVMQLTTDIFKFSRNMRGIKNVLFT